ncbi:ECF transporter S component [Romboutsia sp. 1001216sp1]|uniref:ECF transporter S component n=1 Tax=unclassified Romboutsia TaxID=2626894 RepID=UPI001FABB657|nr:MULTISPECIES: ECF transporter S component [unclassified Romboutsia]MDB8790484.1 ECF transporter S component [Romboutsia sp. 1001216sp1]MDB8802790.1 ECF transporter S component [Romboutsia sp. 1001216sp1]MDB8814268.1 ECF transporter S component [Romboutsia sp. 1001216sp1]
MNVQTKATKNVNVRKMAIIGVLSAVSIMMSMIPGIGYIPIGPTNATIMHVPVIIGSIIEGPIVGATVGFIFGLTSLIKALNQPTITSFAFINPLVSILPRVLIGILAYYIYEFAMKLTKKASISGLLAGGLGSIINTAGVLGMIYILYGARFAEVSGASASTAGTFIFTLAATNGIPEAIIGALVVSPVIMALKKVIKR